MQNKCKKCLHDTNNTIELVTIKTMVVRGIRKDKHYEAMGDIITASVCNSCIDNYLKQVIKLKQIFIETLFSILMIIVGVILLIFIPATYVRIFGVVIVGIFMASFIQELKIKLSQIKFINTLNSKQKKEYASVKLLNQALPKKHQDAHLKYIPLSHIMNDNLQRLGKEFNVSQSKLKAIRNYLHKN